MMEREATVLPRGDGKGEMVKCRLLVPPELQQIILEFIYKGIIVDQCGVHSGLTVPRWRPSRANIFLFPNIVT